MGTGPATQHDNTGSELRPSSTPTYTFPTYSDGDRFIRRHHCLRHPDKLLVLRITDNEYAVQCNACLAEGLAPAIARIDPIAKRRNQIVTTHLAVREQQIDALTVLDIRSLLPVGEATNEEIAEFIRFCQAARLNPILKEVYLVKYQRGKPASIVIGYQNYIRRGTESPRYRGHKSGVLVIDPEGDVVRRTGEGLRPRDELWGAWIEIARAGLPVYELEVTLHEAISLKEDGTPMALWRTRPAGMVHKCVLGRGFKMAFPEVEVAPTPGEGYVVMSEEEVPSEVAAALAGEPLAPSKASHAAGLGQLPVPAAPTVAATPSAGPEPPQEAEAGPSKVAGAPKQAAIRRFFTVAEFWAAARNELNMGPPEARTILGMTLGEWLNADRTRHWDDAYTLLLSTAPPAPMA